VAFFQALACGLYGGAGLLLHWDSTVALAGAGLLALLFIYLPRAFRQASWKAAERGRFQAAARWARLWSLLQWDALARREAREWSAFSAAPPPMSDFPPERLRIASAAVIGLCTLVWGMGLAMGDGILMPQASTLVRFGGAAPGLVAAATQGESWRLVAAIFLHVGILHLAVNAYALWVLGELVEDLFGGRGLWILFLGGGVAGTVASVLAARAPMGVGASGGVFSMLGATLGVLLARGRIFPPRFRSALFKNALLMTLANLALGQMIPQVDNRAHLAGLAAGFVLGLLLHPSRLVTCPAWQRSGQALVATGGVLVLGWAGWHAVRSVRGLEAYPVRIGAMVRVHHDESGYTMSRPVFWKEFLDKGHAVWTDQMGFALVHRGEVRLTPSELASGRSLTLGGHRFREVEGPQGGLFYATEDASPALLWGFEWEGGWTKSQAADMARRLLSTLVMDGETAAGGNRLPGIP